MAVTTLKLKQQRSRDRRQRILAAATKLFGARGIDRTSLTDIASTAKVPLSSLYDYFADKQALVLEVPEENFAALYARTEPLLKKGDRRRRATPDHLSDQLRIHRGKPRLGTGVLSGDLAERDCRGAENQKIRRPLCAALCAIDQSRPFDRASIEGTSIRISRCRC